MDKLSYADVCQQYGQNIVSYKGRIVLVVRVYEDCRVRIKDLLLQVEDVVQFSLEHFSVVKNRLGMVNIGDSVIYAVRMPVRKMGIGINKNNLSLSSPAVEYPSGKRDTEQWLLSLQTQHIAKTLLGQYPSLSDALDKLIRDKPCTIAVDRQFAIDHEGRVYYKDLRVGMISLKAKSLSETVFLARYQHLSSLIEENYAKTVRNSCPC